MSIVRQIFNSSIQNSPGLTPDRHALQMHEADLHDLSLARQGGYPDVASYRAAIKAQREQEHLEQEANAETDKLLEGVRDLIGHKALCDKIHDDISELESAAQRMERHKGALAQAREAVAHAVKAGAAKLLASVGIITDEPVPTDVPDEQLEARLLAEKRAAASAEQALQVINGKLAIKRHQLAGIQSRQGPFLAAAKQAVAEPLGPLFLKQLAALRETYSLLSAYHSGWTGWETVAFPRPRLDTTNTAIPDKCFKLSVDPEHRKFWRDTEKTLLANPASKITIPREG